MIVSGYRLRTAVAWQASILDCSAAMSVLTFTANQHRLLTSAKASRPGVRLLELDAGTLEDISGGRLAWSQFLN